MTTDDRGHIAVLEDDGTVVLQPNRFDLANKSLTFIPAAAGYQIAPGAEDFDGGTGASRTVTLEDDDTTQITLPFPFVFFGRTYTSLFLNTDGNLTFTESDIATSPRNFRRIVSGPPRIAPLFSDLNPVAPAQITVETLTDRVIFTWTDVGEWISEGSRGRNTFQAVVRSNGVIRFVYRSLDVQEAVVAIGPGQADGTQTQVIDLSAQSTFAASGTVVGEIFVVQQELDLYEVGNAFYRTHPDEYDAIAVFADFDLVFSGFAFAVPVRNNVRGISTRTLQIYDDGRAYGSRERLSGMINMGNIARYPANPNQVVSGSFNSLAILGQEFGHRWLSFADTADRLLLGRDNSHWSFLHNTFGSVMEGNEIQDLGNSRFRTIQAATRFSPLDQYLMGLRPASEVSPWFVVTDPELPESIPSQLGSRCQPANIRVCGPYAGLEFGGRRRDITIDEVIARVGTRIPGVDQSPKEFRVAFVLVTLRGRPPQSSSLQFLEALRTAWPSYFSQAVDGRATMNTELINATTFEISATLGANGSRHLETTGANSSIQVGYATLESAFGVSVFRSLSGNDVRSEAAVPAATTGTTLTVYVERGPRVSTGLALVNTAGSAATVTLELNDRRQTTLIIPGRGQISKFIHELFPSIEASFLGGLTLRSNVPIGVVALRGVVNEANDYIMTAVPVSDGSTAAGETVFPQVADGAGYVTEILLLNPTGGTIRGTLDFSFEVETDQGRNTRFNYEITAGSSWKLRTRGAGSNVRSGFASVSPGAGQAPVSSVVLNQFSGTNLKYAAGVPGAFPTRGGIMLGVREARKRSALAFVNRGTSPADIRLRVRRADGTEAATVHSITLAANGHRAAFIDELIPSLPQIFEGTVTFESSTAVHAITLRTSTNNAGDYLMTSMPLIDMSQPAPGLTYFPQLVDGGNFATEYLFLNTNTGTARMQFYDTTGQPLSITLR